MADIKYIKKLNGYVIKDEEARNRLDNVDAEITNIKNGTTQVGAATKAESATSATNDGKGRNIAETYATKDYVSTNGGKIDNIKVGDTKLAITDKTVTIATDGTYSNSNPLVTQSVVTKLKEDITGYAKGYTFDVLEPEDATNGKKSLLKTLANDSGNTYKVGDSLYVLEQNVPDYWVAEVKTTSGGINGLYKDNVLIGYSAGCYVIYELEAAKMDLSPYTTVEQIKGDLPTGENAVENRIYLSTAGTVSFKFTSGKLSGASGSYSRKETVTVSKGLTGVTAVVMDSLDGAVRTATIESYDAATGKATVSVTSTVSGTVVFWVTGLDSNLQNGAIYKGGEYTYFRATTNAANVFTVTTLKSKYADEELTLYIENEGEASATT